MAQTATKLTDEEAKALDKAAEAQGERRAEESAEIQAAVAEATSKAQNEAWHQLCPRLAEIRTEVVARLARADKYDQKGDDMRISAAQYLAEAEKECADKGIVFRKWCELNVPKSYGYIRKMVTIGKAEDPVKAMLEYRAKINGDVAKSRAKAKADAVASTAPVTPATTTADTANEPAEFKAAEEAFKAVPVEAKADLVRTLAAEAGLTVASATHDEREPMDVAKEAFLALYIAEQDAFLQWAMEHMHGTTEELGRGEDAGETEPEPVEA